MEENTIFPQGLLHPSYLYAGQKSTKRETPSPITTRNVYRLTALVITVLLGLWVSALNAATFTPLGFQTGGTTSFAFDVSGDGSTVVGYGGSTSGNQAFYWTSATGMMGSGVPSSFAYGVNQDGSVIVGSGSANSSNAMRWTVGAGVEDLGNYSGVGGFSVARGVSADGLTVAGQNTKQSTFGSRFDAMRWSGPAGSVVTTPLGFLPNPTQLFAGANDISADGLVIVGYSRSTVGQEGFRWIDDGNPSTADMSSMGTATSFASAVSSDGRFAVGGGVAGEAFLWDNADPNSVVHLGDLPGDAFSSRGNDVSADGSIVVGESASSTGAQRDEAFIWDAVNGMRRLQDVLEAEGIDLMGWTLATANGISDNGSTIVGWGINPAGQKEAWVATFQFDSEAPLVTDVLANPNPAPVFTDISLTATVDDSTTGNANIASAEYSIDGGPWLNMDAADMGFDSPAEAVTATIPAFAETGVHEVCVRGTDEPDNTSDPATDLENACTLLVAYDPNGAFVTGGGWITSQAGACLLDAACELAEGKANFGFVSRYKKNAQLPTGNTEFKFSAGGLDFHSDTYEWLVVNMNGSNAQYKGSGTINGNLSPSGDEYKFMLWARDIDPSDTFRIKIWHDDAFGAEVVVYDNDFDQEIGGGNIVVHTK